MKKIKRIYKCSGCGQLKPGVMDEDVHMHAHCRNILCDRYSQLMPELRFHIEQLELAL